MSLYVWKNRYIHSVQCAVRKWRIAITNDENKPPKNNGWIPTKERLPEKSDYYLATIKETSGETVVRSEWYDDNGWTAYGAIDVIAWCKLPEPYQESDDKRISKEEMFSCFDGVADGLKESQNDINDVLTAIRAELTKGYSKNPSPTLFKHVNIPIQDVLDIIGRYLAED